MYDYLQVLYKTQRRKNQQQGIHRRIVSTLCQLFPQIKNHGKIQKRLHCHENVLWWAHEKSIGSSQQVVRWASIKPKTYQENMQPGLMSPRTIRANIQRDNRLAEWDLSIGSKIIAQG